MLATLAPIHAELGAAYPVAGGTARFPFFAAIAAEEAEIAGGPELNIP